MAMANMNLIGVFCDKVMACTSVGVRRRRRRRRRCNQKQNPPKFSNFGDVITMIQSLLRERYDPCYVVWGTSEPNTYTRNTLQGSFANVNEACKLAVFSYTFSTLHNYHLCETNAVSVSCIVNGQTKLRRRAMGQYYRHL